MAIDTPTVSIISLLSKRSNFIPLLKFCVQNQIYSKEHLEWIILDDGPHDRSQEFEIEYATYIKIFKKFNIGRKRQMACNLAVGEFIIFFDDDDFHFPNRIKKSVSRLQKVGARFVTGNSKMLVCDISNYQVYVSGPFHKNHCTAGTMCFRKEILSGTSFRNSDKSGEEAHFLKNWEIPVVQLNETDTIICMAHNNNTVNKSHLLKKTNLTKSLEDYNLDIEAMKILTKIKKNEL